MNVIPNDQHIIQTDLFSLRVHPKETSTHIKMELLTPFINTSDLPATYPLLEAHLPSVLQSRCFNSEALPFKSEVRQTEIGHLFEHILLEYLCQIKASRGFSGAVYNGLTEWDWERDTRGVFHITVDAGRKEHESLILALNKAVDLTAKILKNEAFSN